MPDPSHAPAATLEGASERVEELFVLYERRLGQFLAQLTRSRTLAEDLLQETFLVAFRERDRLPAVEAFLAPLSELAPAERRSRPERRVGPRVAVAGATRTRRRSPRNGSRTASRGGTPRRGT